ncbi:MAG TPA: hypothetical protein VJ565_00030 [Dehalococcoidia bacterium]|nr:hypothetical protein [Dehalococcoidia bacterium]
MGLEEHLGTGETVLGRAGRFHVTEKRLIRYDKWLLNEEMQDLIYPHLASLSLVKHSRTILAYIGAVLLALGVAGLLARLFLELVYPRVALPSSPFIIVLLLGAALLVLWLLLPRRYYQVRAVWFREKDDARWQIGRVKSAETRRLVAQVRELWLEGRG